ncbi:MAG: msrB [Flavipsychrobacter sp.]|nr:msrB [Flavipsychrobacter sp.]
MKNRPIVLFIAALLMGATACTAQPEVNPQNEKKNPHYSHTDKAPVKVSNAEWKKILIPEAYSIMRLKGTERAGTGPYVHNPKSGTYYCAACGNALFSSATKFDSHTGWPSFFQSLPGNSVAKVKDADGFRDEIECARCGGHLGHVFDDGPKPTGLRYCMNGYALMFEEGK